MVYSQCPRPAQHPQDVSIAILDWCRTKTRLCGDDRHQFEVARVRADFGAAPPGSPIHAPSPRHSDAANAVPTAYDPIRTPALGHADSTFKPPALPRADSTFKPPALPRPATLFARILPRGVAPAGLKSAPGLQSRASRPLTLSPDGVATIRADCGTSPASPTADCSDCRRSSILA
jgi:hypothetical protein